MFQFTYIFVISVFLTSLSDGAKKSKVVVRPLRLSSGETPIQEPGWKHCVHKLKATSFWNTFESNGYPILPKTQVQCSWLIEAPIGYKVKISFNDLNLATPTGKGKEKTCRSAYVKIIDMTAQKSQGKFCGNKAPGNYVSIGSWLRIDIQGDKSRVKHRGFAISYIMIEKAASGFRARRKLTPPSDAEAGKVKVNELMSNRRKLLKSKNKAGRRNKPGRLIYASNIKTTKPATTTESNFIDGEGWAGGKLPEIRQPTNKKRVKIQAKSATVKPKANGIRIQAKNQRKPIKSKNNGKKVQYNKEKEVTGWMEGDNNLQDPKPENSVPRYFGQNTQLSSSYSHGSIFTNNPPPSQSKNVIVVHGEGITTIHLIIMVAGIIASILIVAAIFLFKHFYCNKRRDQNEEKEKQHKDQNENPERTESMHSMHRTMSLPGLSRSGSVRSLHSQVSFQPDVHLPSSYPSHHGSQISTHRSTSQRHTMTSKMSRHQSLVAEHQAIYRNHRALSFQKPHQTLPPQFHNSVYKRPLPPIPKENVVKKQVDVDEDYCSGSDEYADVTTMRRELSKWEIEQQRRKKFPDKYM